MKRQKRITEEFVIFLLKIAILLDNIFVFLAAGAWLALLSCATGSIPELCAALFCLLHTLWCIWTVTREFSDYLDHATPQKD
jgi:hypothetical protein